MQDYQYSISRIFVEVRKRNLARSRIDAVDTGKAITIERAFRDRSVRQLCLILFTWPGRVAGNTDHGRWIRRIMHPKRAARTGQRNLLQQWIYANRCS
jgi:hypothetical protein